MARLSGQEYKNWVAAFQDAFANRPDVAYIVKVAIGKELDQVVIGENVSQEIEVLIRKADDGGWLRPLLEAALERQPERAMLGDLATDFKAATIIEPDSPFDALRIFGEAMFDRSEFRTKLKGLQSDGGAPVLVVHGERYSGKTWSVRLISHVVNRTQGVTMVLVDLAEYEGKVVDAAKLGELIAAESGLGEGPEPNEEMDSQWIRQFCNWFGREAKGKGDGWWIVIDHLEKVLLGQGATNFLHGLGRNIPMAMPMVRLIVLSYHDPASLAVGIGRIERDEVPKMTIDQIREWLANFFAAEFLARQREAGVVPDLQALQPKVAQSAEAVLSRVTDRSPKRLVQMGDALRDELAQVQL